MASLRNRTTLGARVDRLCAEVSLNDTGMISDIGRTAVGQFFSVIEDGNSIAGTHHDLHVMLNEHHADAGLLNSTDHANQAGRLRLRSIRRPVHPPR